MLMPTWLKAGRVPARFCTLDTVPNAQKLYFVAIILLGVQRCDDDSHWPCCKELLSAVRYRRQKNVHGTAGTMHILVQLYGLLACLLS